MSDSTKKLMIKNNEVYDTLKYVAQIVLPALAALYFGLSEIWGFPYGPEIVGTITVVDTFLGVTLGISSKQYEESDARFDGTVNVIETEDMKTFQLDVDGDPYDIDQKETLTLRVNKEVA